MDLFAPEVWRLEVGPSTVLYHGRTGRSVALGREALLDLESWTPGLAPPPGLGPLVDRLTKLSFLADAPPLDLASHVPMRSRLVLTFPRTPALWLPLPAVRTPSGHAYAERALTPEELQLWRAMNGSRSVAAIAEQAGVPVERVLAFVGELVHPLVQALQLRDARVERKALSLQRLVAPDRVPRGLALQDVPYRVYEITGVFAAYDERDNRLAHTFGLAHPALQDEPFGARLHRVLADRGVLSDDGDVVLVDPDPDLSTSWQQAVRAGPWSGQTFRVTQRASPRSEPGVQDLIGRSGAMPLQDGSAALVVMSEVTLPPARSEDPGLAERLARYGIEQHPHEIYNLDAWKMLEEAARVLGPGGAAIVVARGGLDERVEETVIRNRPEFNVHFGHLAQVAEALGFDAQFVPLAELMGFDLGATWLARHSFEALRARLVGEGKSLVARAWTEDSLAVPWPVEGIDFVSLREEGPGPLVSTYGALILRR